jgi:hypothetical protein
MVVENGVPVGQPSALRVLCFPPNPICSSINLQSSWKPRSRTCKFIPILNYLDAEVAPDDPMFSRPFSIAVCLEGSHSHVDKTSSCSREDRLAPASAPATASENSLMQTFS